MEQKIFNLQYTHTVLVTKEMNSNLNEGEHTLTSLVQFLDISFSNSFILFAISYIGYKYIYIKHCGLTLV